MDSTSIARIGYDSRQRHLGVEFRASGQVYLYFDVPPEEHAAVMAAESKGTYLNKLFKPRGYRYKIVRDG